MAIQKHGIYNDIDPESLPPLPARGTIVTFHYTHSYVDPIPKGGLGGKVRTVWRFSQAIPPTSEFFDPKKEQWVKVGLVYGVNQDGSISRFNKIKKSPQEDFGRLEITIGNNSETDDLYQYLMMASFVDNVPGRERRNENEEIILRYIDTEKNAAEEEKQLTAELEAMTLALGMTDDQVQDAVYLFGLDATKTNKQLRNTLANHAKAFPADFMLRMQDQDAVTIALINKALALEVVKIDAQSKLLRWTTNDSVLMELPFPVKQEVGRQFVGYLKSEKNPDAVVNMIKTLINAAEKKNKRTTTKK